jgi:translation initiation factor 3 subunit E
MSVDEDKEMDESVVIRQEAEPAAPSLSPSSYDLIHRMSPFLDLHMVFPLIQYAESLTNIYNPQDLLRAKLELLEFTNMVDYAITLWGSIHAEAPPSEMSERRQAVVEALKNLTTGAQPLLTVINDATLMQELRESKNFNLSHLETHHAVSGAVLENFFSYGKFQFECGNYDKAQSIMALYRELDSEERSERAFDALWGKLASEILMIVAQWEETTATSALNDLKELQRILEARDVDPLHRPNPLEQLQLRSWMLHWSLFVFFHQTEGRSQIVEFFLTTNRNRNVIETNCPWLLRYVVAAVIANKNRRYKDLQMLIEVVEQEKYEYSDPITKLLECLTVNFNFEKALDTLALCERVLTIDYFLAGLRKDFVDNARTMIFETYCRLNSRIDIALLCSKLEMPADDAERWIVELVRNAKLDAKIDLESNSVVMGASQVLVWENVMDKTKDLSWRTFKLAGGIASMQQEGLL